jgi:ATP-dependent DNA helicase RecQ
LARAGRSYRERHERDLERQQRLVDYAEGRTCRWRFLLGYFGDDEALPAGRCGHCDVCKPERAG